MTLFNWFKQKEPEDFEQVLASLALDIQKRQARLSEIRQRERRTTLLITLYTLAIWAAYVCAWYLGWRPLKAYPIIAGPIIIQFSRRIAQAWYERIGNAEEKTLKLLLSQQRSKVEEIKKKTNYYSTKNLIERYDSQSSGSPARPRPDAPPGQPGQPQTTPQRAPMNPQGTAQGYPNGFMQQNRGQPTNMPLPGTQIPQGPLVPPRQQWFDRLVDALLGDDDPDAAKSRYALICQKCFAHNGLVEQEQWEDIQYFCRKCDHFNPSMRALKAGRTGPGSPTSSSQPHAQPIWQAQRRAGPRPSAPMPTTGPLLHVEESDMNRRRSLPAPNLGALGGDREDDAKQRTRRSPLADAIELPSDSDEDGEQVGSEGEEERGPLRRRKPVAIDE